MRGFIFIVLIISIFTVIEGACDEVGLLLLKLPKTPSGAGFGEAVTSVMMDSEGVFWNPASTSKLRGFSINLSHSSLIYEFKMSSISLAYGFKNLGTFGLGFNYLNLGTISETTIYEPDGTGESLLSKDTVFSFNYSRLFFNHLSAGTTIKYAVSDLAGEEANIVCFDFGLIYLFNPKISLGLWGSNLGSELKYISESDPLPEQYRFGLNYRFPGIILSADAVQDLEEGFGIAYGTQIDVYKDTFIFRAGRKTYDTVSSFSAGVGIKYLNFRIDYTFNSISEENLYDFNQISIGYSF